MVLAIDKFLGSWLVVMALVISVYDSCGADVRKSAKPHSNVVLISIDTLRADKLNCYGYRDNVVSPNVDALAVDGVLFENFITSSPWTTPAHMTMITSLYPSSHGLVASFSELKKDLLKGRKFFKLPEHRTTLAEALRDVGFVTGAFTAGGTVASSLGFGQGFSLYENSMYKLDEKNMGQMFNWVLQQKDKPFFLFWHNFEVHAPYLNTSLVASVVPGQRGEVLAAELSRAWGEPKGGVDPIGGAAERKLSRQRRVLTKRGLFNREMCEALYVGGIGSMDRWLGQFVQLLRENGLYDNTMIIFTSDHGEEFGERLPENIYDRHGHTLYEEIVHVPLIIKLPGQLHRGTRFSAMARMVDVMPTILDVIGVRLATNEMQGATLRPFWEGSAKLMRRPAFVEAIAHQYEKKGVRSGNYKYVLTIPPESVAANGRNHLPKTTSDRELYDLQADPGEKRNLLAEPMDGGIRALVEKFDRTLREFVARQSGRADPTLLDEQTLEKLKELGYVDEGPADASVERLDVSPDR